MTGRHALREQKTLASLRGKVKTLGNVVRYKGKNYLVMSLDIAITERDKMVSSGEENVCILDCSYYGGKAGEYIVVSVEKGSDSRGLR